MGVDGFWNYFENNLGGFVKEKIMRNASVNSLL